MFLCTAHQITLVGLSPLLQLPLAHIAPSADYTGAASEQGAPSARGTNLNFPLPLGTTNEQYLATLLTASEKIIAWQPDFLLVSCVSRTLSQT